MPGSQILITSVIVALAVCPTEESRSERAALDRQFEAIVAAVKRNDFEGWNDSLARFNEDKDLAARMRPLLIRAFRGDDPKVATWAYGVLTLSDAGAPAPDAAKISTLIRSSNVSERSWAILLVSEIGPEAAGAGDALVDLIRDTTRFWKERTRATGGVVALRTLSKDQAAALVKTCGEADGVWRLRMTVKTCQALDAGLGDQAVPWVAAMATDKSIAVPERRACLMILGHFSSSPGKRQAASSRANRLPSTS